VCYYGRSDSGPFNSYWATYAVYQRAGSGEEESYVKVSEMFRAVRTTNDDVGDGLNLLGFNCYTDSIDAGDSPLTIQAGDIIGACVFDPPGGDIDLHELEIVGQVSGESLLQADLDCTIDNIPSIIQLDDLRVRNDRRLHIYANIEPGKILVNNCVKYHHYKAIPI
jgi:hypothetical protein